MSATREPVIIIVEPYGGSTRRHSPELPHVFWDDAAVTRGDGIFETLLIRGGTACNVERHLDRFSRSAQLLDLPEVPRDAWRRATQEAADAWGADEDGACVWSYSRGRATTGNATAWIVVKPLAPEVKRQREKGVKVLLAPKGYTVHGGTSAGDKDRASQGSKEKNKGKATGVDSAPWLTVGAKTLNYAAAMAALRYARAHGLDDVIYVDGERILEGATSTLVLAKGNKIRTPSTANGDILHGTTQAALFSYAQEQGINVKAKDLTVDDLRAADSVWLVSAARTAVRVTHLGEEKLPKAKDKNALNIATLVDEALAAGA